MLPVASWLNVIAALLQISGIFLVYIKLRSDAIKKAKIVNRLSEMQILHSQQKDSYEADYLANNPGAHPVGRYDDPGYREMTDRQEKEMIDAGYVSFTYYDAGIMMNHIWSMITHNAYTGYWWQGLMVVAGTVLALIADLMG